MSSTETALARSWDARSAALARTSELEKQLQGLSSEIHSLRTTITLAENREEKLHNELREAERVVAQVTDELQRLRLEQRADAATIGAQKVRISELSESVESHLEKLDRAQRLLAADRDIRELMGARNLHIIDVLDVDGKGKPKKHFGRVFYTESESLVFYAFDLDVKKFSAATHSFQAWGYREPGAHSAQSLGIFYVDDEKQKRWVLKVDDPEILQEIDAVFVTVEPRGGAKKPTGQKLLYAYLRNNPNHP
jgi:hypothetical protein